jgi:hypothetical protein
VCPGTTESSGDCLESLAADIPRAGDLKSNAQSSAAKVWGNGAGEERKEPKNTFLSSVSFVGYAANELVRFMVELAMFLGCRGCDGVAVTAWPSGSHITHSRITRK